MNVRLSEIAELKIGFQSREGIRFDPSGSHQLIQARDVNDRDEIKWSGLMRINPTGASSKNELLQNDILFLARGEANFSILIEREADPVLAANTFYIIRVVQPVVMPQFVCWWLNQVPAQEYIKLHKNVGTISFISVSKLSNLEIPIPPIEIQNKIVTLISLSRREIELTTSLQSRKSALSTAIILNTIKKTGA